MTLAGGRLSAERDAFLAAAAHQLRAVGQAWIGLRPRGVEEPSRLADCAVVHLGLGRRDVAFPANAARPLLLHLQDLGNGRWLLAVRECDWEREAGCTIGCAAAEGAPFADLAMRSPCVGGSTGLRALSWRQGLAAFIGRETEVKAFARTLVSGNGG